MPAPSRNPSSVMDRVGGTSPPPWGRGVRGWLPQECHVVDHAAVDYHPGNSLLPGEGHEIAGIADERRLVALDGGDHVALFVEGGGGSGRVTGQLGEEEPYLLGRGVESDRGAIRPGHVRRRR